MNMRAPLTSAADVQRFALAGNARITLRSTKTQARFTYRIRQSKDGKVWFVSLLRGPDNGDDYTYIGLIKGDKSFTFSKKLPVGETLSSSAKAFEWFEHQVIANSKMPETLEVWHEGRCGRCARPLTVPESISHGFGPECIKHVFACD